MLMTTGRRTLNVTMRNRLTQADGFIGLPPGAAKVLMILAAFKEAYPYLGLPASAYQLVDWLASLTQPCDWEGESRPIVWPSARRQQEVMGMTPSGIKKLNRLLYEAGIFVIRDSVQGKRYGHRGQDGRIIEAYGFDLSPLLIRRDEFIRIAAAAKIERDKLRELRKRKTLIATSIMQTLQELVAQDFDAEIVTQLAGWRQELLGIARAARGSDDLGLVVQGLERCKSEADAALKSCCEPVDSDPEGPLQSPHQSTLTNLTPESKDTVVATETSSQLPAPVELIRLIPGLSPYVGGFRWSDVIDGAQRLGTDLGVSQALWARACQVMGRQDAAIAMAIVTTKPLNYFTSGPAGYFGGMVKKAERGDLRLNRTLWKLRRASDKSLT